MKITIEFNLPDETTRHLHAMRGASYFDALKDIIEWVKQTMEGQEGGRYRSYENVYGNIFRICKENGFSPWDTD